MQMEKTQKINKQQQQQQHKRCIENTKRTEQIRNNSMGFCSFNSL